MSRKYFVKIVAVLPVPFADVVLTVPLQIGSIHEDGLLSEAAGGMTRGHDQSVLRDEPPSYWEAIRDNNNDN